MRKRPFALLLVLLASVAAAAALSCSGPPGAPGAAGVTGPQGSPGPTGTQGPTGNIGGLADDTIFRHVVIESTSNTISASFDSMQVGSAFFGPHSFSPLKTYSPLGSADWQRVLVVALSTSSVEMGLADTNFTGVPSGVPHRQVGWARVTGSVLVPFRQVDRTVTYLPPLSKRGLLVSAGTAAALTALDATTLVPPGVRQVFVQSHISYGTTLAPVSMQLSWSHDGVTGDAEDLLRCTAGGDGAYLNPSKTVANTDCTDDRTVVLDASQRLFYMLAGGGAADIAVTGYVDETL